MVNSAPSQDHELALIKSALSCLRSIAPGMQDGAIRLIAETLTADRVEAKARLNTGSSQPAFWLPAHMKAAEFGAEATPTECADLYIYDAPDNGPLRVVGYAPVVVKYAVRVPTDDGYEIELFDQPEDAQKLRDAIYAEPVNAD